MVVHPTEPLPSASERLYEGGFHPVLDLEALLTDQSRQADQVAALILNRAAEVDQVLADLDAADRRLAALLWTDLRTHDR